MAGAGISISPNLSYGIGKNPDKLKIGMIGVGLRGTNHLNIVLLRDDVLVTAICDIDPDRITLALNKVDKIGKEKPKVFGSNEYDYKNILALKNVDAVIIATPWLWHTRTAEDAMLAIKYTGIEVSAANTLEECWDLV